MKILFITYNLKIGGAQKALIKIANSVSNEYSVTIISLTKGNMLTNLIADSINLIQLENNKIIFSIYSLIKVLNNTQPKIIVSTIFSVNLIVLLLQQLKLINANVIIREETTPSSIKHTKIKDKIIINLCKIFFKKSNAFVAPSQCALNDSIKMYNLNPQKTKVIPNSALSSNNIRLLKTIKKNKCELIFVGRISREKRVHLQLKALSILKNNKSYNFKLRIVGPVAERAYKKELIKIIEDLHLQDIVLFEGPQIEINKFYEKANILLLTSIMEGFPSVIIEALSNGLRVVAYDCKCGPKELLNNGKFGILLNEVTPEVIAESVLKAIEQPIDQNKLNLHLQKYSDENIKNNYIKLFESLES